METRAEAEFIAYTTIITAVSMYASLTTEEEKNASLEQIIGLLNEFPGILDHGDLHNNLTIVHYAIASDELELLKVFLNFNPDFNVPRRAACEEQLNQVIGLDQQGKRLEVEEKTLRPADMYSPPSATPLHRIVTAKGLTHWREMIVLMVENGANPLGFDGGHFTPLESAKGMLSELELKLITINDPNAKNRITKDIMHYKNVCALFENILKDPKYQDALANLEEAREKNRKEWEDYYNKWKTPLKPVSVETVPKEQPLVTKSGMFSAKNPDQDDSQVGIKRVRPDEGETPESENDKVKKKKQEDKNKNSSEIKTTPSPPKSPRI